METIKTFLSFINESVDYTSMLEEEYKKGIQMRVALEKEGKERLNNYIKQNELKQNNASTLLEGAKSINRYSDQDIIKYLEPQTSKYYIGGITTSIKTMFFVNGFWDGGNGKYPLIKVIEKYNDIIKLINKYEKIKP